MKYSIEPLERTHKFVGFSCGLPKVDNWFKDWALQNQNTNACKVFLLFSEDRELLGFFTTSATCFPLRTVPADLKEKFRYDEVPAVLIGWMGRGIQFRGRKIGTLLLIEALKKAREMERHAGVKFVVADALNEESVKFFKDRSFIQLIDDGKSEVEGRQRLPRLVLPIETAKQMVEAWENHEDEPTSAGANSSLSQEFAQETPDLQGTSPR